MVKEKENETNNTVKEPQIGLVTIQGEVGLGMKMPDGEVIDLGEINIGLARILAYVVTTVSEIKKNIS